jgi:hypothetical protein
MAALHIKSSSSINLHFMTVTARSEIASGLKTKHHPLEPTFALLQMLIDVISAMLNCRASGRIHASTRFRRDQAAATNRSIGNTSKSISICYNKIYLNFERVADRRRGVQLIHARRGSLSYESRATFPTSTVKLHQRCARVDNRICELHYIRARSPYCRDRSICCIIHDGALRG